jgi:hypothetical protein
MCAPISPRRARTVCIDVPSVLSGGSPRRLFLHAGKWVLEVVRHVNLGHDLIRPTAERVAGQRAIGTYFKNNPDKAQLGKATQRLMQNALEGETLSFTAEGTDWIANSIPPPPGERRGSQRPQAEAQTLETLVGELEARVVVLTAVQEGLLTRLARLEARIAQGAVVAAGGARPERSRARVELGQPKSENGSASGDDFESPSEPDSESAPERGRVASASDASADSARENDADDDPGGVPPGEPGLAEPEEILDESGPPRLLVSLPPVHELSKCLVQLVGGDVTAKAGEPPLSIDRTLQDCYAAALLDDRDQTVGIILMDLKALVFLGGTLMMLPRTEMELQLKSVAPGEDSIAAASEICNALSGPLNGFQKNEHVRLGALQKFDFNAWRWLTKPQERRDLEDSFGGRIVVASRPPTVPIG